MAMYKCIGCGAALQSEDKTQPGFVPANRMQDEDVICQRCFRLKNYNETPDVMMESGEFMTMLNSIFEKDGIVLKIIDVFDFKGSLIPSFNRIVGNKRVIAVINKVDLLPKSTNMNRVISRAKKMLADEGITAHETITISAIKGHNLKALLDIVSKESKGQDIYIVGTTNVGKSTLINKLIEDSTGEKDVITTSNIPGTTLGLIDIPISETQSFIDTPGVVVDSQMTHFISPKDLKVIMPKKEIKPKNFQLNEGQTLFISSLARVDFVKGERSSFTVYASDKLKIHRTKTETATDFYSKHYDTLLAPPEIESPILIEDTDIFSFRTTERSDILISGLTFVSIDEGVEVDVTVPKGVEVSLRPSVFKGV
ncbi:ribosome biogenesis GTPase YqeH [Phocicoccus pinnipedialis]|uniref:Ribosome biogenesis GTPase A n=1 Tax=Phocicoccus pinnipedialis TaxID=110845 RepID=A0A6V7RGS6_9BACL|nr:ribosome biogenesis GTPase YqeH [Jeotgalicoccus pinnipedialis]CAD2076190.1 Ribosome biogenesis GTPase A [Jeotgalicoccus pinnipedialis]